MEPIPLVPNPNNESAQIAALAELNTRLLDTIAGFEKVLEKAEPELRDPVMALQSQHRRHAALIAAMLARAGHPPEQDGSVFANINRALIEMRSWFGPIGENLADNLIQTEKHLLEGYELAVSEAVEPDNLASLKAMHTAQLDLMEQALSSFSPD